MAAESGEYVQLFGVDLVDPERYEEYRRRMTPVLRAYGGDFEYDLTIARVLRQPGPDPVQRVFSIVFPSRERSEAFFADREYRAIRAAHFDPAVRSVTRMGSYERDAEGDA